MLSSERLLIVGDLNIHVDVPDDADAIKFLDLLECMRLTQHVITPTHRSGHSLDLIITRDLDGLVQTLPISDSFLSDHCTVLSELTLRMPAATVKEVCYRKTRLLKLKCSRMISGNRDYGRTYPLYLQTLFPVTVQP